MTIATPSAVPICRAVLLRPEASPDSCSATPASAATVAVTKARPIPRPHEEQPEEDVREVAATHGDLREHERPRAHERHAGRGDRAEADLEDRGLTERSRRPSPATASTTELTPNLRAE